MPDSPARVTGTLTTVAMLSYVAWLIFLFRQLERVARVTEQRFAGEWDQRVEVLSFMMLPPNTLILAPAAIAASLATFLAGSAQQLELAVLLRVTRWSANLLIAVGAVSAVVTLLGENGSPTRIGDVGLRIAGILLALAMSLLCRDAERNAPAG